MHRNEMMMSTTGDDDLNGYKEIISSERLGKDVSNIMNSAFWIDALKKGYAKGMGDQLSSQLKSAHDFAHEFVHSYIELRRMSIKKNLMNKQFKQQQQQLQQTQLHLPQQQQQQSLDLFNNTLFEEYFQFIEFDQFDDESQSWLSKFLIEFSYLAILDFDDFLATSNLILNKITEWFPDFNISNKIRRGNFEKILKDSNYFKRLMNVSKSNETTKPIILKKKQSIWSINQNHIKQFFKTFQRMKKKYNTTHSTTNSKSAFLASSKFWKLKMEQVKLLIQIKHNGYLWFYNTKRIEYHVKEGTRCLKVKELKQEDSPHPVIKPYHQQTSASPSPIFTNLLSPISTIISPTITPTTLFPQTPVTSIEHFFDIDFRSSDNEICIETL